MKKILLLLALLPVSLLIQAQEYENLLSMFVDEDYEKCLYKAEKYTLSDETKRDPLPYLFMSMSYFEMSKREEFKESYPDAGKNALKYASKYAGKDKERKYVSEYTEFFNEIRAATIAEAEVFMDQMKYTKTKSYYNYLIDLDPNDAGAFLMLGLSEQALKSKKESTLSFNTAKTILAEKKCYSMTKEQRGLLKEGLIRMATNLDTTGDKATAKEWLDLGLEYFQDDKEYQVTYETITG